MLLHARRKRKMITKMMTSACDKAFGIVPCSFEERERERERERGGINDSYRNRAHNGRLYKGQREVVNNDERSLQKADWMKHKRWRLEKNLFWTLFYTVMLVKAKCNLNSALTEWLVGNRDRSRGQSHTPNQFSSFLDQIFRGKKNEWHKVEMEIH